MKDPLSEEEILARDFYSFVVVATHPINGVGETAVLISLPQKTCEGMQVTEEFVNVTTVATSVAIETTEYTSTISTLIDSETTEKPTPPTTLIDEATNDTTLVDSESSDTCWNETTPQTTKGYCS